MKFKVALLILVTITKVNAQNLIDFQLFEIDTKIDTVIYSELGAEIAIQKLSFKNEEDKLIKDGIISLKLKEVVDTKDMLLEGITTEAANGILVSNGMILIEAYVNDEKVTLKKETPISVKIPATNGFTNMSLFTVQDSTRNWQKTNAKISLEPCSNYREQVIMRNKEVTKSEYKKWQKKQKKAKRNIIRSTNNNIDATSLIPKLIVKDQMFDRLFGGNSRTKKTYTIPIPVDTVWRCTDNEVANYNFNIKSLGWHNIDKFKRIKNPVSLTITTTEDLDIYLIFDRQNICIKARKQEANKYKFYKIPKNKQATIIAYKNNNNGEVNFISQNIYTQKQTVTLEPSKTISLGAFKRMLKLMRF